MSIVLIRGHIALAGLTGLILALLITPAAHFLGLGSVVYTVIALTLNVALTAILSKVYSRLSGGAGRGPVIEAGLAQILAFLVSATAIHNLIP